MEEVSRCQMLKFDEHAPFLDAHRAVDEKKARPVLGCAKTGLPRLKIFQP